MKNVAKTAMVSWLIFGLLASIVMLVVLLLQLRRMEDQQVMILNDVNKPAIVTASASAVVVEPTPEPTPKSQRPVVVDDKKEE